MHVVVAVKQVPATGERALARDGRLRRDGVGLEMSAFCRRALSKGIELARATDGSCSVVSLGPPSAEQVLREALACGADDAVLLSDPVFAGSDTLVTARALAELVRASAPVDLVLVGRASLDAETGQVGPQLAELLDLPFAGAVRELELDDGAGTVRLRCETDDGSSELVVRLPAVLSVAERCCPPAKAAPGAVDAVARDRVRWRTAAALASPGPWGAAGSPTRVEALVAATRRRAGAVCAGSVSEQVSAALRLLAERGALDASGAPSQPVVDRTPRRVPGSARANRFVAVLVEPGRHRLADELFGAGAALAHELGGGVTAVACEAVAPEELWARGVDACVEIVGSTVAEDVGRAVATWSRALGPGILLAPATSWGREVAARVAARLGAGLVADALDLDLRAGRLSCTKPACGSDVVATITTSSTLQIATVRPGALPGAPARPGRGRASVSRRSVVPSGRVEVVSRSRDEGVEVLERAEVVVGVGRGVAPEDYGELRDFAARIGAALGATRKVTDRGLMPQWRQIGITGRSIAPRLYIALGIGGSPNHLAGVRRAGTVLGVNADPEAAVFAGCDVGIVGDWREVVAELVRRLDRVAPRDGDEKVPADRRIDA